MAELLGGVVNGFRFIIKLMHSGFEHPDQEQKYNLTLFDLLLTLASRVKATLADSNCFAQNSVEAQLGTHI